MNSILEYIMELESAKENQAIRMLYLLDAFAGKKGTGSIDGISKLAVYDFMLKYPSALEKMLSDLQVSETERPILNDYEMQSVYASTMRYCFAPWSFIPRETVAVLKSKSLISITYNKTKSLIHITEDGEAVVMALSENEYFLALRNRCNLIKKYFGSWSLTKLVDKIHSLFPEILNLKSTEVL